ncbi:TadE/TadG family type IV pilus assembly protein [Antribacter gilvus]|uniref:TadE/TadG family type IV pilus assembly protein n=1 Tax=Antribacter gilvus TaxID=2304675 RepID=UPI001F0C0803|nr:TadE/TadG family type IV pilus assembly protein [Antribacter gilvus]
MSVRAVSVRAGRRDETGNVAVNTAVIFPVLLLVGLMLIMAGRLILAEGVVQSAANEAARSASISRTAAVAAAQAQTTATTTLANSNVRCARTTVQPNTQAFQLPLGETGTVQVTVACVVPLADLGLPGVPGSRTITATGTSVLDAYRGRS